MDSGIIFFLLFNSDFLVAHITWAKVCDIIFLSGFLVGFFCHWNEGETVNMANMINSISFYKP